MASFRSTTLADQPDQVAVTAGPIPMDEEARLRAAEILSLLDIRRATAPASLEPPKPALPPSVAPAPKAPPGAPATTVPSVPSAPVASGAPQGVSEDRVNAPVTLESGGFPRNPARVLLSGRSILGVMTFLAQHVEVPAEHFQQGLAHQTRGPDGKPFDWNLVSHGIFVCTAVAPSQSTHFWKCTTVAIGFTSTTPTWRARARTRSSPSCSPCSQRAAAWPLQC